jgi:putative transposase
VRFIDEHQGVFGVEPICRVLSGHGAPIAPSTYYAAKSRPASARAVRDEQLKAEITRVWKENYEVYGADKVWLELNRQGISVARCTVERLMRGLGLQGARCGRKVRTTVRDERHERAGDLLGRDFTAPAPKRRWVADFTHVTAWCGIVYVAFVVDIYSRAVVGWAAATHKRTKLVLDALQMALWRRDRDGHPAGPGLLHHSDSEYVTAGALGFPDLTAMDATGCRCQVAPGLPDPHFRLTDRCLSPDMSAAREHLARRLASPTV